jgi:DNA-binding NtrC family response regulator
LPGEIRGTGVMPGEPPATRRQGGIPTLEDAEREVISRALLHTRGNKTLAARHLGISRQTLRAKVRKYRIEEAEVPVGPS